LHTSAGGFFNATKRPLSAHENILIFYSNQPVYNPQKTTGHKPVNANTKRVCVQNNGKYYGMATKQIVGGGSTERYPRSVIKYSTGNKTKRLHPNEKPQVVLQYIIKTYTNEGDIVLDNVCGSGSTLEAAWRLNRRFIGMEKDLTYFSISKNRILNLMGEKNGFFQAPERTEEKHR
jgi:site-specific DNA-methyltransferase (adenine-specific)